MCLSAKVQMRKFCVFVCVFFLPVLVKGSYKVVNSSKLTKNSSMAITLVITRHKCLFMGHYDLEVGGGEGNSP